MLINLIYSPLQLFSIGFQLSYLLTFIIIEGSKLNQLSLGLKLNAYSFPIVLWHTYQWNFLTWILTIAIIPIFEWLIIPAVLVGCLFPPLTGMANQVLDAINGVFNWLATLPFMLTFGKPPLILLVTTIIVLNLIEVSWVTKKAFLILGLFVFYLVIAFSIKFPLFDEVVYFDIGQGDSTLIRTRFNRSISLVDTGGKVSFTNEKWQIRHSKTNGETVVANYLLSKGINHLDN
ncbi:ComEC/Rec2 family competence protein, partial [Liquorilactobacillus vini]|uniref:ComEC/Rec2 family competence protein n=1 Tax=Liquorilactobacillus vini TaxID=238015 RepID=UPI001F40223F